MFKEVIARYFAPLILAWTKEIADDGNVKWGIFLPSGKMHNYLTGTILVCDVIGGNIDVPFDRPNPTETVR